MKRRKTEGGQALLLMVVAAGIVLAGALGLAIDVSQLYPHTQMAQSAADIAAEAGAQSILNGTWSSPTAGNCTLGTDTRPPCLLALKNGFGATGTSDVVAISFPSSVSGVTLTSSATFSQKAVQVTITRPVKSSFIRMVGGASTTTIKALAVAGLVTVNSPIPILVLDPHASSSFSIGGTPTIKICGGSQTSIQVNSDDPNAVHQNGTATVDLSKGGPADTAGNCSTGTGTDFRVLGGPASGSLPSWMTPTGSTEHYYQPSSPISDPYASVAPPTKPADGTTSSINTGTHGCAPQNPHTTCTFYTPGHYTFIDVQNDTAVFSPGVYYIDGKKKISGTDTGFGNEANGNMMMCSDCAADASTNGTGNTGMMVYLSSTAGTVNIGANATASLNGSSSSSVWEGLLFYEDRSSSNIGASLGGGGAMTLTGTIYLPTQTLSLQGGSGSGTLVQGEIVVDELALGGNGSITMDLNPNLKLPVIKIALVK